MQVIGIQIHSVVCRWRHCNVHLNLICLLFMISYLKEMSKNIEVTLIRQTIFIEDCFPIENIIIDLPQNTSVRIQDIFLRICNVLQEKICYIILMSIFFSFFVILSIPEFFIMSICLFCFIVLKKPYLPTYLCKSIIRYFFTIGTDFSLGREHIL